MASNIGIETTLSTLTSIAWRDRLGLSVHKLAYTLTDPEANLHDKMRVLVDVLHRRSSPAMDADDACLIVASLAMSVGIRCRFVGARYGQMWTCWLAYEVGDHWDIIDPMRQRPDRDPDEQIMGPIPGAAS